MKSLEGLEINDLKLREAMLLPNSYTKTLFSSTTIAKNTLSLPKEEIQQICDDLDKTLEERYWAAKLINIWGDKRISTFTPNLIEIPSIKNFKQGTTENKALVLYEKYRSYGVKKEWILKETPQLDVDIKSFYMAKYPITNLEYLEFLTDTKYPSLPLSWELGRFPILKSNCPVHSINIEDAKAYTEWLSKKTNLKYRLPTETEWEYVACSDENREFPWGNEFNRKFANTVESGILEETPVGIFVEGQSKFGNMDMAGNVEEFVNTTFHTYGPDQIADDDLSIRSSKYYITRGGSYTRFADLARTKRRHGWFPSELYKIGFRICMDKEQGQIR